MNASWIHIFPQAVDTVVGWLQALFIFIMKPFSALSQKMGDRLKNAIVVIGFSGLFLLIFSRQTGYFDPFLAQLSLPSVLKYILYDLIGCFFIAVLAAGSVKGPLKKQNVNTLLSFLWIGMVLFFVLSAIFISRDHAAQALIFMFVLPLILFIWNNRGDYGVLFSLLMKVSLVVYVLFILACVFLFPITAERYLGVFTNPNSLGMYVTFMLAVFLFYYGEALKKKKILLMILNLLGIGSCTALMIFTQSRAAVVAMGVLLVLWLVLQIFVENRKNMLRTAVATILPIAAVIVVMVPVTMSVNQAGNAWVDNLQKAQAQSSEPASVSETSSAAPPASSSESVSLGTVLENVGDRLTTKDKNLEQFSSYRLKLWRMILAETNLLGHERTSFDLKFEVGGQTVNGADNSYIQIIFDNGIFAGIFFFFFTAVSGFRSIFYYVRRKEKDRYAMFPVLIICGFVLNSLFATLASPFGFPLSLAYWLVQAPLFEKKM